ncbi:zinc-finger homeodomain protein 2-like [Telopea speciosissima]|uniref:zinc-finger homeodomain protein 2-like n=1 Tax=Telopea speciosissima TaxID=54955 RepID=UPI001CC693FA|nr:zinc-finger homeodomain protein 2-like [Telopea speciosissima]
MELRGHQEKEIGMPSSLGFNPPIRESTSKVSSALLIPSGAVAGGGGDERRRDGTGNGTAVFNSSSSQTLDHHRHLRLQQEHPQHHHHHDQRPDPDPVPVAIAVGGATGGAAVAGGSNSVRTPTTPKSSVTVRYRECLKNHAANIGAHVVDGCGEFMPSGEEGTPEALKCAACECHRNFHRKEVEGEPRSSAAAANCYYCFDPNHKNSCSTRIPPRAHPTHHHPQLAPPHLQQQQKFQLGLPTSPSMASIPPQPMMMAYGGGGGGGGATESSSEDLNVYQSNAGGTTSQPPQPFALSKKRFRTKFTQYQKEKMLEFAEKLGWKMQKQDETEVQRFCEEVSVKRQVLKVWMHNNKHAMKKKQL